MAFSPSSTVCWPISDPPVVSNVTVWRFGWGFWFSTHVAFKVMSAVTGRVNYRDDERRGLDVGVTPATLVREVVAGTPSIMGG